jgi:hypothetical protein
VSPRRLQEAVYNLQIRSLGRRLPSTGTVLQRAIRLTERDTTVGTKRRLIARTTSPADPYGARQRLASNGIDWAQLDVCMLPARLILRPRPHVISQEIALA